MRKLSDIWAELQRNFGRCREAAIWDAVTLANHGRDTLAIPAETAALDHEPEARARASGLRSCIVTGGFG